MHNSKLLICVSLFMTLSSCITAEILDYKTLCVKCVDEKAFPECPLDELANHLNLTIYCQRMKDNYCTLGILNGAGKDVFSSDTICRIKQIGRDLEKLQEDEDHFKIISIIEEPLKPLPLLLQTTTESVKMTTNSVESTEENVKSKIEVVKDTTEAAKPTAEAVKPTTEAVKPTTEAVEPAIETVKPTTETVKLTTAAFKSTIETVKPITDSVKPTIEPAKATMEAASTSEKPAKRPNDDTGHIQILSITQEAIEPSKPNVSHMAIVANPDAMAALEEGADADNGEETAAEAEPAEAPEPPAEAPEPPAEAPEVPAVAPEPPAEAPDAPADASETPTEAPEAPEAPAEAPAPPADAPDTPAEAPDAPAEAPDAPADSPDTPAEAPAQSAEESDADKGDSNKEPMDYQGDEAKPDVDIDADEPPAPAGESDAGKVTEKPNAAGNKPVPALMKCFACSTLSYTNCTVRADKEIDCHAVEAGKSLHSGCYTMFNGEELQRGCLSDLTGAELQNCFTSSRCRTCATALCNNATWPECYSCDSTQEPLCAQWSASAFNQVKRSICPHDIDYCMMRVDETGVTQRLCANATAAATCADNISNRTCVACSAGLCNGGIFPPARQRCLQCGGDAACAEAKFAAAIAAPCLLYRNEDRCFLYANTTNQIIRGCVSDISAFEACRLAGSKCLTCSNYAGCNDTPLMKTPTLKCFRCNSLKTPNEYESCIWSQASTKLVSCVKKYRYYQQESCLTIYNEAMSWAVRECSLDFGACEPNDEFCQECNADGCNGGNMAWQECVQCSSILELDCGNAVAGGKIGRCMASEQTYELRGCYTMFNVNTNVTSRGCISDLAPEDMKYCKDHTKHCQLCHEQGCNKHSASVANFMARLDMSLIVGIILTFLITSYV